MVVYDLYVLLPRIVILVGEWKIIMVNNDKYPNKKCLS